MKQHRRSWLTLVSFLVATTLASSLVFAAVFAAVTAAIGDDFAQAADESQADPMLPGRAFSGIITDARCGARHTNRAESARECARICVANGSTYAMVDGDKTYELAGDMRQIHKFAGQRVTLIGNLEGGTLKVSYAIPHPENERALR